MARNQQQYYDTMMIKSVFFMLVLFFKCSISQELEFLPPNELKVASDSEAGDEIGSIKITGGTTDITFHIRQILDGRQTIFDGNGNQNNIASWENIALDETNNDCSLPTLQAYKGKRRLFCINHQTGKLFATQFFETESKQGDTYSLEVIIKYDGKQKSQSYFINIVDYCDQQKSFYEQAIKCTNMAKPEKATCRLNSTNSPYWKCNITSLSPYYVVGVELSISSNITKTRIEGEIILENLNGLLNKILIDELIINNKVIKNYPTVGKLIDNIYFKEDDSGNKVSFQQQFGVDNVTISQVIISDRYLTCGYIENCSDDINAIDFKSGCFDDNYYLKLQDEACKAKPYIQLEDSHSVNLPIEASQKIFEIKNIAIPTRSFEIISIEGPNLNFGDTEYPTECNSSQNANTTNKYFCINPKTGSIYTTVNITELQSRQAIYKIELQIIDTSYPTKISNGSLMLTLNDTCNSYLSLQNQMNQDGCNIQTNILKSFGITPEGQVATFDLTSYTANQIIGIKLQSHSIGLEIDTDYTISMFSANVNHNITFKMSTSEESLIIKISLPEIFKHVSNLSLSLANSTNQFILSNETVQLVVVNDWSSCVNDDCITKQKEYFAEIKTHCISENDQFINTYFESCQDIKPVFIDRPKINDKGFLVGCNYSSRISIGYEYTNWLINNSVEINGTEYGKASDSNLYIFPRLDIEENFNVNVSYRCLIYDPLRMKTPVLSEELIVPLTKINPRFVSDPYIDGEYLKGCNFHTKSPFPVFTYWLMNDSRILQNSKHNMSAFINGSYQFRKFKFPKLFDDTSFRCVLFVPGKMDAPVVSTNITVPGREIKPVFISGPEQDGTFLKGCTYLSNNTLQNYTYWLVNESTIIRNNYTQSIKDSQNLYSFSEISLFELVKGASYQCGIFNPDRMRKPVLSEKIYPKLLRTCLLFSSSGSATDLQNHEASVNRSRREARISKGPTFLSGPILKEDLYLTGCNYTSEESLWDHSYWLINDVTKVYSNQSDPSNSSTSFPFPLLQISNQSDNTYQCGIYNRKFMEEPMLSEKFQLNQPIQPVVKDAEFVSAPTLKINQVGEIITIQWCNVLNMTSQNVRSLYWLKDGIRKLSVKRIEEGKLIDYESLDLNFNSKSAQDSYGYFQCVLVQTDGKVKMSERKVVDYFASVVSKTSLDFLVFEPWAEEYLRNSSEQSKLIETLMYEIVAILDDASIVADTKRSIEFISFSNQKNKTQVKVDVLYNEIDSIKILETCDQFHLLKEQNKFNFIGVHLQKLISYDCCFKDILGHVNQTGIYEFETTLVSKSKSKKKQCVYDETNHIERFCEPDMLQGAYWKDVDVTICRLKIDQPDTLEEIEKIQVCSSANQTNCSSVTVIANDLSSTVGTISELKTEEDFDIVDKIVTRITDNIDSLESIDDGEEVLDDVLTCLSVVVASPTNIISNQANASDSTAEKLLTKLDKITKTVADLLDESDLTEIDISKENIGLKIKKIPLDTDYVTVSQSEVNGELKINISDSESNNNATAQITIPNEVFKSSRRYIHSFVFRYETLFDPQVKSKRYRRGRQERRRYIKDEGESHLFIDGKILSATVGGEKIENLKNPVKLKFKKMLKTTGKRNCYFWEFKNDSNGNWSTRGCNYIKEDELYVYCECNHLTNFALLLDASQKRSNPFEMKLVTWIGCGISLFGLIMTIISYGCLRKLRAKLAPKLLLCLCFSLTMLLVIFIFGAERSKHQLVCKVIAALLQFFTLSTFFWMAVEAYNLYRCFVRIFKSNLTDTQFLLRTSILAWGAPLVITLATSFTHPDRLGTDDICIIYGTPFYYGLLLPVSLILFGNFLALYFVITGINDVSKSTSKSRSHRDSNKQEKLTRSRIAFTCSLLLGLSWVFAVLAIGDLAEVFQWLFCIFSSLQGFFIFIFYTVKNREVWDEWKRFFGLKPSNEYGSSSFKKSSRVGLYATSSNGSTKRFSFFRRSTYIVDDVFTENKV